MVSLKKRFCNWKDALGSKNFNVNMRHWCISMRHCYCLIVCFRFVLHCAGLVEVFSGLWGQRLFACWRCVNTKCDAFAVVVGFSILYS